MTVPRNSLRRRREYGERVVSAAAWRVSLFFGFFPSWLFHKVGPRVGSFCRRRAMPMCFVRLVVILFCFPQVLGQSNPHKLGVGLVSIQGVATTTSTVNVVIDYIQGRQFNLIEWWSQMSNGAQTITTRVNQNIDIFAISIPNTATSCSGWGSLSRSAFQAAGGGASGAYDSYIWVMPSGVVLTGCSTIDAGTSGVAIAALGPCAGGCDNFVFGSPYINTYIYVIGRNKGLSRSHASLVFGDLTCQMGSTLTELGSQRRGFNALKLNQLGLISVVPSPSGATSFSQFLSAVYVYEFAVAGSVKLMKLEGTNIFISYRSPRDVSFWFLLSYLFALPISLLSLQWKVDRSNNWGSKSMTGLGSTVLSGVTSVHRLEADGSSTLLQFIPSGSTYTIPGTSYTVRQDWNTNLGAQLSVTRNGVLPAAVAQPPVVLPPSGVTLYNTGELNTAEQSSTSQFCYGASLELNMCWSGDDRNSSSFIKLQANVPAGSLVSSALLILEADRDQIQTQTGTVQARISAERTLNTQTYTGDLFQRLYFPSIGYNFTGTWRLGDEVSVDVTPLVQQVVSQSNWVAGNFMSLTVFSAVVGQQFTRTVQSGAGCGSVGGPTPCGPRIRIAFTSGTGGQPAPIDCVYVWSDWSVCAADGGGCGVTGTQSRNLIITTQPANNGLACPTTTRETRSCTTAACVVVPKDCIWFWSEWSACIGQCSLFGTRTRNVIVTQLPDPTGIQCPTVRTETDNTCLMPSCPPVDCVVDWSPWSTCTGGTCGTDTGVQTRTGTIRVAPQYGGAPCPSLTQSQSCATPACVQDCIVTYGDFSDCIGTCGTTSGYRQKVGTIQQAQIGAGAPCPPLVVTESCVPASCPPSDCVYSWSYSTCTGPCGSEGTQTRTPIITAQAVGTGVPCPTASTVSCTTAACVGTPSVTFPSLELTTSGAVSRTLADVKAIDNVVEAVTEVARRISQSWLFNVPAASSIQLDMVVGGSNLAGQSLVFEWSFLGAPWQTAQVVTQATLQRYTVTLSTASTASQILYVRVVNSDTTTSRLPLSIAKIDYLAINTQAGSSASTMVVDCFQGAWVTSLCSSQCGFGTQTLSRPMLQQPKNGGVACGPSTQQQSCSDFTECPTDCVVSSWSSYSACSATCGSGTQTRTRTIASPARNGGAACPSLTETIACITALPACSGTCVYGPYTPSGSCSVPCGGGTQLLTRTFSGTGCTGSATSSQPCNTQSCPGTVFVVDVQATLVQAAVSGGAAETFQAWPTTPVTVTGGTSLILSGRATDRDTLMLANGYWQLVLSAGSPVCAVTRITLACPSGTTGAQSIIGNIGKLQCNNSLGQFATLATASFTITC